MVLNVKVCYFVLKEIQSMLLFQNLKITVLILEKVPRNWSCMLYHRPIVVQKIDWLILASA
jgi:uncharacterized membrane protein